MNKYAEHKGCFVTRGDWTVKKRCPKCGREIYKHNVNVCPICGYVFRSCSGELCKLIFAAICVIAAVVLISLGMAHFMY